MKLPTYGYNVARSVNAVGLLAERGDDVLMSVLDADELPPEFGCPASPESTGWASQEFNGSAAYRRQLARRCLPQAENRATGAC
jgi:hypothetical protein